MKNFLFLEKRVNAIDYAEIRSAKNLKSIENFKNSAVALLAVRLGGVRLLDNILL